MHGRVRKSPERTPKGLIDVLQKPSKPIKTFTLAEALRYSYLRDFRFLVVFSGIVWLSIVLFWVIDPVGLNCAHPNPGIILQKTTISNVVMDDLCPFKAMGAPRCTFFETIRREFLEQFFEGMDLSQFTDWTESTGRMQKKASSALTKASSGIKRVEEARSMMGFDPLHTRTISQGEASSSSQGMAHPRTLPIALILAITLLTLKLVETTAGREKVERKEGRAGRLQYLHGLRKRSLRVL